MIIIFSYLFLALLLLFIIIFMVNLSLAYLLVINMSIHICLILLLLSCSVIVTFHACFLFIFAAIMRVCGCLRLSRIAILFSNLIYGTFTEALHWNGFSFIFILTYSTFLCALSFISIFL